MYNGHHPDNRITLDWWRSARLQSECLTERAPLLVVGGGFELGGLGFFVIMPSVLDPFRNLTQDLNLEHTGQGIADGEGFVYCFEVLPAALGLFI